MAQHMLVRCAVEVVVEAPGMHFQLIRAFALNLIISLLQVSKNK
jgi:hypothetical protein